MRVLVTGSREWPTTDWGISIIEYALDRLNESGDDGVSLVIEGGASGADTIARNWAMRDAVPLAEFPAPWKSRLGDAAGMERNKWMIRFGSPDIVLAFPGPKSRGTWGMVKLAEGWGIPVHVEKALIEKVPA